MVLPMIKRFDNKSLIDEIEQMHDMVRRRAFDIFRSSPGSRTSVEDWLQAERETFWKPPVELIAKDDAFVLEATVPGLDANEIDIQVSKGRLVIKGEKAHEHHEENKKVLRCEYTCGKLFREVELPEEANIDAASATLDKGILTITFPRVAAATRKVPVSRVAIGTKT